MRAHLLIIGLLFLISLASCGGSKSMSSPGVYSGGETETTTAVVETKIDSEEPQNDQNGSYTSGRKEDAVDSSNDYGHSHPEQPVKPDSQSEHHNAPLHQASGEFLMTDIDDSAEAVDDFIWRQFELVEEYHAMGVIANREASWEEAQYYFEKSLHIMADLDIDADSSLTPEAVKYTELLESIVSDYRVTLRSLGNLTDDVSSSVILERFAGLSGKLGMDTMLVFKTEAAQPTYDLPIVMNDQVKSSIVYFQTVAHDAFAKYLRRSKKYKPMMLRILREHGLPDDLIYLSLIESGYNPHAYSWARAMGLWQFISSTGRAYGLNRNWWMDERKDPIKSTHSAARFLKDLYKQFGDWELAMAAYNGGPGRVRRTIKKQKTRDFWKLKLKRQTMDYVPLIMAATIIAKDPVKYGFTDIEHEAEIVWDEVTIDRCLDLNHVAKQLGCTVKELQTLNPELLRKYTPPNVKKYILKVPKGDSDKFWAAYDNMPSPKETSWVRHKIRKGESISTIASKYGVSQYSIFSANNLSRRSRIYAGKTLIVPVPLDREYKGNSRRKNEDYKANKSIYVVRSGDTMWDIARAFGTSVSALRRNNYIERGSRIYVGQKLKIPSSATKLKKKNSNKPTKKYASNDTSQKSKSTPKVGKKSSYKVRAGDTLWDIARKYGTTTGKIRHLNGMGRSSRIYPGQVIAVETGGSDFVVHKIKRGDTLGRLARRYGTSISRIMANNGLTDPNQLSVGVELRIYLK